MDILKILEEQGKELYPEDLDFFETELATGGDYDADYQAQCKKQIKQLRAWLNGGSTEKYSKPGKKIADPPKGIVVGLDDVAPKEANSAAASLTPAKKIFRDISEMRELSTYKTEFKKYVAGKAEIDAAFVDAHYSFFKQWELDAIISVKQMGEDFIEKYFGALDHDKIARYQQFSEAFFIKHFSQLDANIVLERGKNEWRKKENRSKQLDVFLRLKGVKI